MEYGIASKLRISLTQYDALLVYAYSELNIRESLMKLHMNKKRYKQQIEFLNAKVERDRLIVFIEELKTKKQEMLSNLDTLLSRYPKMYRKLFMMYFIEQKPIEIINKETNINIHQLKDIIDNLSVDFNEYYH